MLDTDRQEQEFSLVGGHLSLDFTNTVGGRRGGPHEFSSEHLHDYFDLISWSKQAGALTADEAHRLLTEALRRPEEATAVFVRAIGLREAIYGVFSAVHVGDEINPASLATLNAELSIALAHSQLIKAGDSFALGWAWNGDDLDKPLWPIAKSAMELLSGENLDRVTECSGDTCGWLFLDMSRNHSRHWCDMRDCGNRAKAKRHYHRKKVTSDQFAD